VPEGIPGYLSSAGLKEDPKDGRTLPQLEGVAIPQLGTVGPLSVQEDSVGAAQIPDPPSTPLRRNLGMESTHQGGKHLDIAGRVSSDPERPLEGKVQARGFPGLDSKSDELRRNLFLPWE